MTLWRIKLNSGCDDVDWDEAKAFCRNRKVVGVGWGRLSDLRDGASYDEVIEGVRSAGWDRAGVSAIHALAQRMQEGDFVWTRDQSGAYWLGRVSGPYRYERSDEAWAHDVNNLRPCEWLPKSMRDYEVPGAVVRGFVGAAATLRRVNSEPAERITELIWASATDADFDFTPLRPLEVLTDLVDPIDAEDIVLVFLQAQGWILMPSSRMGSTPLYEATLRHREDGRLGIVSVKSGNETVPVEDLAAAVPGAEVFVWSTKGHYSAPPVDYGVKQIDVHDLVQFAGEHPELLPPRIARWLESPGQS